MKRVLIATVLLAAAGPAAALENDVVVSGALGVSVSGSHQYGGGEDLNLANNASRLGVFASTEEQGIKGFLSYDRGPLGTDLGRDTVREFFGGVTTARWGTLTLGRKGSDYREAGLRVDPFYDTSLAGFDGRFAAQGPSYGLSGLTANNFTENTVSYNSPALFGGVTFNGAVFVDDSTGGSRQHHDYAGGVGYSNPDWDMTADLQYLDINGGVTGGLPAGDTGSALRLSGTYGWGALSFGLSYEEVSLRQEDGVRRYLFLSETWRLTEKLRLAAAYGHVENTDGEPAASGGEYDGNGVSLAAFYTLIKNLNLYAGGRYVAAHHDASTLATGLSYRFDVDLE